MWLRTRRCELSAFDIVGCGLYCALVIIRSDVLWYLVDRWRVDSFYLAEPPYIQLVHSLIMQCTSAAADDVLILLFSFFSLLMVIYYDPIFFVCSWWDHRSVHNMPDHRSMHKPEHRSVHKPQLTRSQSLPHGLDGIVLDSS